MIVEENESSSSVYGSASAPYLNNTLMKSYAYASKYDPVVDPS